MIPDIWSLAENAGEDKEPLERTLVVLGDNKSGKSSVLAGTFQDRGETKPTVALEYSYARPPLSFAEDKALSHVYELGGGRLLGRLVSIPINSETLPGLIILINLDLSRPYKVLDSLLFWIQVLNNRIQEVLSGMPQRQAQKFSQRIQKKWANHPDSSKLSPLPVPVVVIANKYDVFADVESENRKWMARVLRYFCHKNGVSLFYNSTKDSRLQGAVRQIITHYLFGSATRKYEQKDHAQGIQISSGNDSFKSIGPPPKTQGEDSDSQWQQAFKETFPKPSK